MARGILVHRSLLSTSHFVDQTSLAWPPRSATTLTLSAACQRVRVHAGVLERKEGLRRGGRHMKGMPVKKVVEDGPLRHCSHYAVPGEKRQSSGNEMNPPDLLSCDIFVLQPCDLAHM